MKNVKMTITGTKLIIEADLDTAGAPSKSGKTTVLATTSGNVSVPGKPDLKLGLNLYRTAA